MMCVPYHIDNTVLNGLHTGMVLGIEIADLGHKSISPR